jgi:putative RNA 2'-phosphotransferase
VSDGRLAHSKFLSYVLRHGPESIGITLDGGGWVAIDALLAASARHGHVISREALGEIINASGKRRFEVRDGRIRAAQGHSVPVDLGLEPVPPPAVLYHGTVARFLPGILAQGLRPGKRLHVHLSADTGTAAVVGARRGRPVILQVNAAAMHEAGHEFFRAANGVWLTANVPPGFIQPLTDALVGDTGSPPGSGGCLQGRSGVWRLPVRAG